MRTSSISALRNVLVAAGGWTALTACAGAVDARSMEESLQRWLGDRPGGVAAAYVDASGVVFANAGRFSASDSRPVTSGTQFEIGSVTKVFTALLLADSVRREVVTLDAKVGAPFTGSDITYAQLATHTSGLPRLPRDFAPADATNPYANLDLAALVSSFQAEAHGARASVSTYSNFGFAVLGQALAAARGTSYEAALREAVLQPLGLRDTVTSWREADVSRLAPGHDDRGAAAHWDLNAYAPAGALVSTTGDLAKVVQACLGLAETPLSAVLAETMRPRVAGDSPGRRVGLGWMVEQSGRTWHNGGTGGFRSVVMLDPEKRAGVVVLTNHTRRVEALGAALLTGTASPLAHTPDPTKEGADSVHGFLGHYPLSPEFVIAVTADGEELFVQATGQPRLKLRKKGRDRFAVEGVAAAVTFERGAEGTVTALVLHQNGREQRGPRRPLGEKPATPMEIALTAMELEDYVGEYRVGAATFIVKREDTRLLVQLTGQSFLPVFASAKDEFYYKVVDARLSFVRGADGKVVALVLHQNGQSPRAERVAQ